MYNTGLTVWERKANETTSRKANCDCEYMACPKNADNVCIRVNCTTVCHPLLFLVAQRVRHTLHLHTLPCRVKCSSVGARRNAPVAGIGCGARVLLLCASTLRHVGPSPWWLPAGSLGTVAPFRVASACPPVVRTRRINPLTMLSAPIRSVCEWQYDKPKAIRRMYRVQTVQPIKVYRLKTTHYTLAQDRTIR